MRLGGFDYFSDASRAAVCTWQGDVWIVSGLGKSLDSGKTAGQLTWKRIAAGLFQSLGLKIVDDRIYVLGRDQITRLVDLNNDGETDFYENFNNDAQVTEHFHEFAMALQRALDLGLFDDERLHRQRAWLALTKGDVHGAETHLRTAITLELGLQNGTLAIFVAVTLIGNQTMMVPGGISSLLMFVTAGIYLLPVFRREAGE